MKKLQQYAKENNITYRSAYNHFKKGLIENAYQLKTGTIVIPDSHSSKPDKKDYTVTYARVSSSENKHNLEKKSERLINFCNANGWIVNEAISEVGSGINDNRKKLMKIFQDEKATRIVVEHKDRITRFGFNYIKEICKKMNCDLIVINETATEKEDLMQDFISIITSFCSKIYGQRRSKRQTEKLINQLTNEN